MSKQPSVFTYRMHVQSAVRALAPDWAEAGFDFHYDHSSEGDECLFPGCSAELDDVGQPKRLLACLRCQMIVCAGCAFHHQQDHMTKFERECLDDADIFALYKEVHAACTSWVSLALR